MQERVSFHEQISKNKWKSFFLIAIIFLVFLALGYVINLIEPGYFFVIMVLAIIISIAYILITYYNSDKIALASVGAKDASKQEYRPYHNSVEALCLASGMPKPRLYVMPGM